MKYIFIPKYCDPRSVLLINQAGALRRLYCPFRVRCMMDTEALKTGMWLWVEEVASNTKDELIFWILDKPYMQAHFEIHISF